jgi:hypothetical protein
MKNFLQRPVDHLRDFKSYGHISFISLRIGMLLYPLLSTHVLWAVTAGIGYILSQLANLKSMEGD